MLKILSKLIDIETRYTKPINFKKRYFLSFFASTSNNFNVFYNMLSRVRF